MHTSLKLATLAAALAVPVGVSAQPASTTVTTTTWDADAFWRGAPDVPYDRIQFLQDRIDRGVRDGSLTHRETVRAREGLHQIRVLAEQMRTRDGGTLTATDETYIQQRLDSLSRQIRWAKHDW